MAVEVENLPKLTGRPPDSHKGDYGHVLVVAGSPGMTGAGLMAAQAAQRAGAGLVTIALPRSLNLVAEVKLTSAMSMPLPETADGALGDEAGERILERADAFDVVAIGPGLGRAEDTARMVAALVAKLECAIVVDADGLNALARNLDVLDARKALSVLTPHPGEMARLCGFSSVGDVQKDRRSAALAFAQEHGVLLVLKGHGSIVTDGKRIYTNATGNPGMASGGTGDVLTGLVAGLLCQGIEPFGAAQHAVFVHGLAGDMAAAQVGELSLIAEDVLQRVPDAFRNVVRAGEHARSDYLPPSSVLDLS